MDRRSATGSRYSQPGWHLRHLLDGNVELVLANATPIENAPGQLDTGGDDT